MQNICSRQCELLRFTNSIRSYVSAVLGMRLLFSDHKQHWRSMLHVYCQSQFRFTTFENILALQPRPLFHCARSYQCSRAWLYQHCCYFCLLDLHLRIPLSELTEREFNCVQAVSYVTNFILFTLF